MNLGHINYLNCLPLNYIIKQQLPEGLNIVAKVPSELNSKLLSGQLDVSPVSSIIYARNHEKLLILPKVSITTKGKVASIILVSKLPIAQLRDKRILLTAQSATSHCLLKIIAQEKYGVNGNYEVADISPEEDYLKEAEAALFIGDNALYINHHRQADLYYYDLGQEWYDFTGLPMVYALWVTNKNTAKFYPEAVEKINAFVVEGFKAGFAQLSEAIMAAGKEKLFTKQELWDYLHIIKWNLNSGEIAGLKKFYEYAYKLNLIAAVPNLEFFGVNNFK